MMCIKKEIRYEEYKTKTAPSDAEIIAAFAAAKEKFNKKRIEESREHWARVGIKIDRYGHPIFGETNV